MPDALLCRRGQHHACGASASCFAPGKRLRLQRVHGGKSLKEFLMRQALIAIAALPLAACIPAADPASTTPGVTAVLRDASGSERGRATVSSTPTGMRVSVTANGMAAGQKGLHIHDVGLCEGPKFTSAGPHWNPAMKQHGRDNPMGAHMGDAPNIDIAADGTGSASFEVMAAPSMLTEGIGKSIVIHAAADDYRTDPTGNSGDRIACGVFGR
jgi:superoxide dismutase, Cu-Zn family